MGFSPNLTCGVWVGFDDPRRTLGEKEEGAKVALPIWLNFMSEALKGNQPVGGFPKSPLLTKPEQVKQILANASTDFLAERKGPASAALNTEEVPSRPAGHTGQSQQSDPKPKTDATSLQAPRSELLKPRQID
jgi:penicillin-binding protein 1A